jgi:predicted Zn-dependent protease with MMP-like domain
LTLYYEKNIIILIYVRRIKMGKKGEKKITKQFRFTDETMEKINQLGIEYFGSAENKFARAIEEVIKITAEEMGIVQDELIIRSAEDLLVYYEKTADENGKVMSVLETAKKTGISEDTIQRYRTKLVKSKNLKAVSTAGMYLVEGEE